MQYNVHLFAVARMKVEGVEANSQADAIKKAVAQAELDIHHTLSDHNMHRLPPGVKDVEYAEEITRFLVDEVGDEEYERSCWYDALERPEAPVYVSKTPLEPYQLKMAIADGRLIVDIDVTLSDLFRGVDQFDDLIEHRIFGDLENCYLTDASYEVIDVVPDGSITVRVNADASTINLEANNGQAEDH